MTAAQPDRTALYAALREWAGAGNVRAEGYANGEDEG